MTRSLWESNAGELLERASSGDPTPGGGAIAAVTAAFGLGLVRMAMSVTGETQELAEAAHRARELQFQAAAAADHDVEEFDALMAGYRMARETEAQREQRARAIDAATVSAAEGPLGLAEVCVAGIAIADAAEPLVKPTITSDVQAGRELLRGAALAALATAAINLAALEQRAHAAAPDLARRHGELLRAAGAATGRSGAATGR